MLTQQAVHNILESWPVAVLSTYGEGVIDSVPVVFVLVDGMLYSPVDGKPKSDRQLQRVKNLRRDSRYTLLVQHYDEDWPELWWLRLSGEGSVLDNVDEDSEQVRSIMTALADKYPQYGQTPVMGESRQLLRLSIDGSRAWAYQGLDWLADRFR
jgi:PPOX class probable F420-dependent enzyme